MAVAAIALAFIGVYAPTPFLQHLTVFVLACFVGYHVIWNVTPALHTPLMSVTNAISGIIVIGALLQVGSPAGLVVILAGISVLIATINVAGGFWVTQRMLRMFRKD
jgi:NAD(P) transhydrogenase subunit alpha